MQCHVGGNFTTTPTDCYCCHTTDYNGTTNPNHVAAGFPKTCLTCHLSTIIDWTGATFNHTCFPMTHGNANSVCSTCHTNSNDYSVFTCTGCHLETQTDPKHSGVRNYVYNSTNCYAATRGETADENPGADFLRRPGLGPSAPGAHGT